MSRSFPQRSSGRPWRGICALLLALSVHAQDGIAQETTNPLAPADTSNPRAMLITFIDACNELQELRLEERYFDRDEQKFRPVARRILDCLDDSHLPSFVRLDQAGEAAVCLKEVLDRVDLPPERDIPGPDDVEPAEGREPLLRWQIPGTRIVIARVVDGPQRHEYLFSPGTVDRAVDYFRDVEALTYRTDGPAVSPGLYRWYVSAPGNRAVAMIVDRLPDWTRNRTGRLALWQWVALVLSLLAAVLLTGLLYRFQRAQARKFRDSNLIRYILTLWFPIVVVLIPLGIKNLARNSLGIRGDPLYVIGFIANVASLLAVPIVVFAVCNRIAEMVISSPSINPRGLDAQFVRIVSKLTALAASSIVMLEGGQHLGIPLTTLLASAGVSGLAVALAAQDSLKNLFGTITLMADKPFRVGERVIVGKYDGVVEDIGLRSTRIRLLTGHQATIPNDQLASSDIENVGRRQYIRRVADLNVPLDTPHQKIESAVKKIRTLLENHEGQHPDLPPRVFFNEFNPDSFNIRVMYWYHPPDYWAFLAFSETLNLEIFRAFEEQGITFSRTVRVSTSVGEQPSSGVAVASIEDAAQGVDSNDEQPNG